MIFKWITFGRLLERGIKEYHNTRYNEAKLIFENAWQINKNDFLVNFWLIRSNAKLGYLHEAQKYLNTCLALRPDLAELVNLWKSITEGTELLSQDEWLKLEGTTDELLKRYQNERIFNKKDLRTIGLTILGIMLGSFVIAIIALFLKFPLLSLLNQFLTFSIMVSYAQFIPFILIYYNKTKIKKNFWDQIRSIECLFRNKTFQAAILFLLCLKFLGTIIAIKYNNPILKNPVYLNPGVAIVSSLFAPICEEVVFRGIVFKYVKKFNTFFAYLLSSMLFYYYHGIEASSFHFFLAVLFAFAYEKFGTLNAPIVLHSLQNIFSLLVIIIYNQFLE